MVDRDCLAWEINVGAFLGWLKGMTSEISGEDLKDLKGAYSLSITQNCRGIEMPVLRKLPGIIGF